MRCYKPLSHSRSTEIYRAILWHKSLQFFFKFLSSYKKFLYPHFIFKLLSFKCLHGDEGQFTDFFSYTSHEFTKKSNTNHKITRKITYRKHQQSQITDKLVTNHTKKSLEITKITKKSQKKNHVISKSQKSRTPLF